MKEHIHQRIQAILSAHKEIRSKNWEHDESEKEQILKNIHQAQTRDLSQADQQRIRSELEQLGPIQTYLDAPEITEILINQHNQLIYEKNGMLFLAEDFFFSQETYHDCIERLCQLCGSYINKEKPFIETQLGVWRITIIYGDLSRGHHLLSIRKQSKKILTLQKMCSENWCTPKELALLKKIIDQKENFIVVGGTSSGKTTVLQALLHEVDATCRHVIIEDTQEIKVPNLFSASLLTSTHTTMSDLLKRALRLRPDRLVIGEIRSGEAKDLLMALSTGHEGSCGSLHAKNQREALLRLEMLIQMGAPQWQPDSIRKLIGLTIRYIIVVKKDQHQRSLEGIYKITSVESTGITSMKIASIQDL